MQRRALYANSTARGFCTFTTCDFAMANAPVSKSIKKLARVSEEYPTKTSVRLLADAILAPLNRKQLQAESARLARVRQRLLLPICGARSSSFHHRQLQFLFSKLDGKLNIELRNFRTVHAQRILREIPVGRITLVHIKAFLSAVFKHCKQQGVLDGVNPVADCSVPGRPVKTKKAVYGERRPANAGRFGTEGLDDRKANSQHLTARRDWCVKFFGVAAE